MQEFALLSLYYIGGKAVDLLIVTSQMNQEEKVSTHTQLMQQWQLSGNQVAIYAAHTVTWSTV